MGKIRSDFKAKYRADHQAARTSAVEEYKSSEEYHNIRDDLYSVGIDDAVKLLHPKNLNQDVSDINDESETIEEMHEKESEAVEQ